jgi:cytochrome c oxidase subunit I+III
MWDGKPRFRTPLLFVIGFIVIFVLGGLTGVMLAAVPLDLQVHDTYFVVAHFHYVLIGGAVFPLFGGDLLLVPEGHRPDAWRAAGPGTSGLFFVGFNVTFFPMHLLGLIGMPRRIYTYKAGLGWDLWNLIASLGSVLIAVQHDRLHRQRGHQPAARGQGRRQSLGGLGPGVGDASPPPAYNFAYVPVVASREPGWEEGPQPVMEGLASAEREILCTSVVEAEPDMRHSSASPAFGPWRRPGDDAPVHLVHLQRMGAGLGRDTAHHLPDRLALADPAAQAPASGGRGMTQRIVGDLSGLDTSGFGSRTVVWWGILCFILIEGCAFALAGGSYLFLMSHTDPWPPHLLPNLLATLALTAAMLLSEIPNVWTRRVAHQQKERATQIGLIVMSLAGLLILGLRFWEFTQLNVRWDDNAYGSIVWALIILHTTHLITDLGDTVVLTVFTFTHEVDTDRFSDVTDNCLYWHFVVLAWLPIHALIYWVPRLA